MKFKKIVLIVLTIVLVLLISAVTYFLVVLKPGSHSVQLKTPFEPIPDSLNDEQLLRTSLIRLLSVEGLSYDAHAENLYEAEVAYLFDSESSQIASRTQFNDGSQNEFDSDYIQKGDDTYFRYTKRSIPAGMDNSQNKYLNQWILVNKETSQGIGAGSEFLGMALASSSSMEAPFVIGNMTDVAKQIVQNKIDAGLYKITSTEHVTHKGSQAVKYILDIDYRDAGRMFIDIYDKHDSSRYVPGGYVLSSFGYGMNTHYDRTASKVTIYISSKNAEVLELSREIGGTSLPVFSSKNVTYDNFQFDSIVLPETPTTTVPFNQFYK